MGTPGRVSFGRRFVGRRSGGPVEKASRAMGTDRAKIVLQEVTRRLGEQFSTLREEGLFPKKVSMAQLSHFANSLSRCLNSGVNPVKCVELSAKFLPGDRVREAMGGVRDSLKSGQSVADAFAPAERMFPGFFVPVVACGEASGRLIPGLKFIAEHARQLSPVAKKLHDSWFYLVVIAGSAWLVVTLLRVFAFGLWRVLLSSSQTLIAAGIIVVGIRLVQSNPKLRRKLHELYLAVPFLRDVQREWTGTLFMTALELMYGTAVPARRMLELAAGTSPNMVLGERLRASVGPILDGTTFAQALAPTNVFSSEDITDVRVGEEAGELEGTFGRLAKRKAEGVYVKMKAFSAVVHRIAMYVAAFYIALQVFFLATAFASRRFG